MTYTWTFDSKALAKVLNKRKSLIENSLPALLEAQAEFVKTAWQEGANGKMYPGMTRPLYSQRYRNDIVRGNVQTVRDRAVVTISSLGNVSGPTGQPFDLVQTIEDGRAARDLKPIMLRSRSARRSKSTGEPFVVIPFRHGAGESVHFKSNIGPEARRVVRKFGELNERTWSAGTSNPFLARERAERVLGPQMTKVAPAGHPFYLSTYTWQRRMFAGLRRYGARGHSQYMTFRTVSGLSDPSSWIAPAVPANPIFKGMAQETEPIVRENVKKALQRL